MPLADFAQQIFHRNFAVVEDDGTGGRSADAHLVFFTTDRESRESFLDQESGELFAVDFGKDSEQIGEAGVGDPHLFAVQGVVFAVLRELGAGAAVHRVRAGRGLRQCICPDNLAGSETRQVFPLLLLSAEINDGERADPGVSSPGRGKASPAFFRRSRVTEKSLCSIFSMLGTISLTANSSAV